MHCSRAKKTRKEVRHPHTFFQLPISTLSKSLDNWVQFPGQLPDFCTFIHMRKAKVKSVPPLEITLSTYSSPPQALA